MVWASAQDSADDAAPGIDSVKAKPLKKRCSARAGLSRFYSSKSQSFSSLELVQSAAFGASAFALAKRPSSFDLRRGSPRSGLSHTTSAIVRSATEEACMSMGNEEDDSSADRCPCNDTIFADPADAFISPEGSPSASPLQIFGSCSLSNIAGASHQQQQFQLTSEYLGQLTVLLPFQQAYCGVGFGESSCCSSSCGSGCVGNASGSSSGGGCTSASGGGCGASRQRQRATIGGAQRLEATRTLQQSCSGEWSMVASNINAADHNSSNGSSPCSSRHRNCLSAGGYLPDSNCSGCGGAAAAMQPSLVSEICGAGIAASAVAALSAGPVHARKLGLSRHRLRHSVAGRVPGSNLWGSTEDLIASLTLSDKQQQQKHALSIPRRGAQLHRPPLPGGSSDHRVLELAGVLRDLSHNSQHNHQQQLQQQQEAASVQPQSGGPKTQPMPCGTAPPRCTMAPECPLVGSAGAVPCCPQQQQSHMSTDFEFERAMQSACAVAASSRAITAGCAPHGFGAGQQQPWAYGSAPSPTFVSFFSGGLR